MWPLPPPVKQAVNIKELPAASPEDAKKAPSKQRVNCPVKGCRETLLRECLEKHITKKHAFVATIAEAPAGGSRRIMEEAALGLEAAADLRRKRSRLPDAGALSFQLSNVIYVICVFFNKCICSDVIICSQPELRFSPQLLRLVLLPIVLPNLIPQSLRTVRTALFAIMLFLWAILHK
jgi:hypothetical protein